MTNIFSISMGFYVYCITMLVMMWAAVCILNSSRDGEKILNLSMRSIHCDKSLGEFRAIARSAAGNKWYSTELSEVKNPCYSWLFN